MNRGLVSEAIAERIERSCRTTVGDSLRSITYFTPGEFTQLYLRSDLDADADLERLVEHESAGFEARSVYRGSELGSHRYTVRSFENGFVTRVIRDEEGVFVTTDGLTMHRSEEVAEALSSVLKEG